MSRLANSSKRVRNTEPESNVKDFTDSMICTCVRESKLTMRRYQMMRRLSKRADQLLSCTCFADRAAMGSVKASEPGVGSTRSHPDLPSKISAQACASEFFTMK